MVKIRLKRKKKKKNPFFRIVVIDIRSKREGAPIEELGYYNPKSKELKLDKSKALEWVKKGAQPTDTVKYLIEKSDDEGKLVRKEAPAEKKLSKKAKAKLEAEKEAQAAAAAAAESEAAPAEETAQAEA